MRIEFLCISVLRVASGPRVKLASCKSALNPPPPPPVVCSTDRSKAVVSVFYSLLPCAPPPPPPVVYSTDRSKAVVPMLIFVALWFILRGDFFYVFPCVILFWCFSVLLVL